MKLKTGCSDNCDSWIKGKYPDYTEDKALFVLWDGNRRFILTPEKGKEKLKYLSEGKRSGIWLCSFSSDNDT